MSERENVRTRSREPEALETEYNRTIREREIRNQKLADGKVIIKGGEIPWELNRQYAPSTISFPLLYAACIDTILWAMFYLLYSRSLYRPAQFNRHHGIVRYDFH